MKAVRAIVMMAALAGASTHNAAAQERAPLVAVLSWWSSTTLDLYAPFRRRLGELGYVEGRNIALEFHFAEGISGRAASLAGDLARRDVKVILAMATPAAHAAKAATTTIPIVMMVADPLATGLVPNISRPGGNITGMTSVSPALAGKRLELLREILPRLARIAFLGSTRDPNTRTFLAATEAAAQALGVLVQPALVGDASQFKAAFAAMAAERIDAVVVQPLFIDEIAALAKLSLEFRLPLIADQSEFARSGSLLSYGVDRDELYIQLADYVDKILKGAKPGDLPVGQVAKFKVVVNLKTAKALGFTVPPAVLERADEVIE